VADRLRAVLCACAILGAAGCGPRTEPWNVLIVVADDLGADLVRAYGEGEDPASTPNIDALAARGVLFRRAWANPLCSPTRATIQTGRYSFRTGIGWLVSPREGRGLPDREVTLAELVQSAPVPYRTGAFGKWHVGTSKRSPNQAGYARFEGTLYNLGNKDGAYYSWSKVVQGRSERSTRYVTTDTADSARSWIESSAEPWLAYVAFHAPHSPYHGPPQTLHSVDLSRAHPRRNPRPYVKAMVEAMDGEIGRLLEGIEPEVLERTAIFFLSDNGSALGGRAKSTLYERGVRVPFIVSGPVVTDPGRESLALVSTADLFATVSELAGVDLGRLRSPGPRDSVSLLLYLRDPAAPSRRQTVFAEKFFPNRWPPEVWDYAVRNDRYKLIRVEGEKPPIPDLRPYPFLRRPEELYDLEMDPLERDDLLARGELSLEARSAYEELDAELERLLAGRSPLQRASEAPRNLRP
jgi:arylsulfatase A-like enzyme